MATSKLKNKPLIYEYHDYMVFLKDWLEHLRKTDSDFSMRQLSQKAGLAVGYLPMCLKRQRRLSEKAFHKLVPHLKLNKQELRAFELLRTIGESESPQVRSQALEQIQKLQVYKTKNSKEIEVFEYLKKWYHVAIREMVSMGDFRDDPQWIQSRLRHKLSLNEIAGALEFLKLNGFVERKSDGTLHIPDKSLDCTEGVFKISLGEFHRQMLDLTKDSIESVARHERLILGQTLAIRFEDFDKLQMIMQEALEKVQNLSTQSKEQDCVYHLTFASIPLTQRQTPKTGGEI